MSHSSRVVHKGCWTKAQDYLLRLLQDQGQRGALSRATSDNNVPEHARRSTSMLNHTRYMPTHWPYQVSAQERTSRDFVFKTYNYIFTGDNVDVIGL